MAVPAIIKQIKRGDIALELMNSDLALEDVQDIATALRGSKVQSIDLYESGLGDEKLKALVKGLVGSRVVTLNISCNKLTDDGLAAIAKILPDTYVRQLHIAENDISDKGAEILLKYLPKTDIKHLYMQETDITPELKAAFYRLTEDNLARLHNPSSFVTQVLHEGRVAAAKRVMGGGMERGGDGGRQREHPSDRPTPTLSREEIDRAKVDKLKDENTPKDFEGF